MTPLISEAKPKTKCATTLPEPKKLLDLTLRSNKKVRIVILAIAILAIAILAIYAFSSLVTGQALKWHL